jgi:hypothetical protein
MNVGTIAKVVVNIFHQRAQRIDGQLCNPA